MSGEGTGKPLELLRMGCPIPKENDYKKRIRERERRYIVYFILRVIFEEGEKIIW